MDKQLFLKFLLGFISLMVASIQAQDSLPKPPKKKVAAIMFTYYPLSHADVIIGRILYGYSINKKHHDPAIQVVSMVVEQTHKKDMSKEISEKLGIPIYPTVEQALTMGKKDLQVDGVVFIGEHGDFPYNETGQHLYPRYRVFKEIVDVFKKTGRTVPVYTDKHFSTDWKEAKWMYDQSKKFKFPLMAGSSLPLWWRNPPIELEHGALLKKAVVTSYGETEAYGFHGLEALQCLAERRKGGEIGIKAVQCLEDSAVWAWTDSTLWAKNLLDAALPFSSNRKKEDLRTHVRNPVVFIVEYNDGLQAAIYRLEGYSSTWVFSGQVEGVEKPITIQFTSGDDERPAGHFSPLVYHIEQMIVTGKPSYPVERTLLTTGALATLFDSKFKKGERIETPFLNIKYKGQKESLFWR